MRNTRGMLCRVLILAFLIVTTRALAMGAEAAGSIQRKVDQVIFASGGPRSGQNLFTMKADGTDQKQITSLGNLQSANPCCTSPDKRKIVFTFVDSNPFPITAEIYIVNSDGTGLTKLIENTDAQYAQYSAEDFSPNGKRILFVTTTFPTPGKPEATIQTMKSDGSEVKTLTQGSGPRYSPNGGKIAYVLPDGGLSVMNADGSHQRRLTVGFGIQPSWSPDGKSIAFIHILTFQGFLAGFDLSTIDADGENLTDLTHDSAQSLFDLNPAYAPYGNSIVFTRVWASGRNVFRVTTKKTIALTQLTKDDGSENPYQLPAFDPSGAGVFYTSTTASGGERIYSVGLDGADPVLLATNAFLP